MGLGVCGHACHAAHVEARGHLCGVDDLLPLSCVFSDVELRSARLVQQVLLPTQASHWSQGQLPQGAPVSCDDGSEGSRSKLTMSKSSGSFWKGEGEGDRILTSFA